MKKLNKLFTITVILLTGVLSVVEGQNIAITDDNAYTADSSAMLDVKSLTKGFLTPRMTSVQRTGIASPATGLLVFDTNINGYYYYNGTDWINLSTGGTTGPFWSYTSPNIYMTTSTDNLGIGTSTPTGKLTIQGGGVNSLFFEYGGIYDAHIGLIGYDLEIYSADDMRLKVNEQNSSGTFEIYDEFNAKSWLMIQNNGNVGIGTNAPGRKLIVKGDATNINEAIFAVQNNNGDTVFAVYPEGVRIWVNDDGGSKASGSRGGFAVGGFNPAKAGFTNEYLRVTPDSVRVYIDDDYNPAKATGSRGGFAVGGFNPAKGLPTDQYLFVQDDSTRVYVIGDEGFAVDNIEALSATEGRYMDLTPENYLIGHHSGDAITGLHNSFFGYETGLVSTSAIRNVFIGYQAGYDNTTADYNNFIGYQAGFNNTSGYSNNFMGYQAGYYNTTGYRNNFIGYQAGYSNTIGIRNTFVGSRTGGANIDGNYNSLYGYYSGYAATLNNNNVFSGYYSGYNADNAESSVMIGSRAGYSADNSINCIMIGTKSGYLNNAANNTFVGTESGYYNTSGTKNVFMGYRAGYNNTIGYKNIFIGNNAGFTNSGGNQIICIGDSAGSHNTANNNIFIGCQAGRDNTSGGLNIFLGSSAGAENTIGVGNTYVGFGTATQNNGSNNVMIGYLAGAYATVSQNNLFIGQGAGFTNTGDDNVFLGYGAGNNNGDHCILIGNGLNIEDDNILMIEGLGSNATPLIYGEFDNNLVGINDKVPSANLHVKQYGTDEEGFAIENDTDTDVWSWEVGANDLFMYFNGTQVGQWDDATGNYTASSDKRLKKDIEIINESVLSKVMQLKPVSYRLNHADNQSQKTIGFIAQDVQPLFPELVKHAENGYFSLHYSDFGIISIKAIQEQQEIINELKKENKAINERLNEIEKLLKD